MPKINAAAALSSADAIARGELRPVLEAFEPPHAPVHLVHVVRGQMPLKMRRFLDFGRPRLRYAMHGLAAH
jgi:hypothetical protein